GDPGVDAPKDGERPEDAEPADGDREEGSEPTEDDEGEQGEEGEGDQLGDGQVARGQAPDLLTGDGRASDHDRRVPGRPGPNVRDGLGVTGVRPERDPEEDGASVAGHRRRRSRGGRGVDPGDLGVGPQETDDAGYLGARPGRPD